MEDTILSIQTLVCARLKFPPGDCVASRTGVFDARGQAVALQGNRSLPAANRRFGTEAAVRDGPNHGISRSRRTRGDPFEMPIPFEASPAFDHGQGRVLPTEALNANLLE